MFFIIKQITINLTAEEEAEGITIKEEVVAVEAILSTLILRPILSIISFHKINLLNRNDLCARYVEKQVIWL